LLVAATVSNLPNARVHLSIMRCKQLVGVQQSVVCNGVRNSHCVRHQGPQVVEQLRQL
jgi:hypothetical protein